MKMSKISLLGCAIAIVAAPALAESPYYFVDTLSNKRPVFTDSNCTGQNVDQCNLLSRQCSIPVYTDRVGYNEAQKIFPNNLYIKDRSGQTACTITGP